MSPLPRACRLPFLLVVSGLLVACSAGPTPEGIGAGAQLGGQNPGGSGGMPSSAVSMGGTSVGALPTGTAQGTSGQGSGGAAGSAPGHGGHPASAGQSAGGGDGPASAGQSAGGGEGSESGGEGSGGALGSAGEGTGGAEAGGQDAGGQDAGGAPAAGGSGGNASGGNASGGNGSGTDCGVTPVTPNASQQVKNVLCYLYEVYGTGVLSGQQETSWSNPEGDISFYQTNISKVPAILGGDYLYPDGTTNRARAYWQAGGLVMLRYHMGAPPQADTYESSKGSANIGNVLTSGTNENSSFESKLDYIAAELQILEDANVAVIWAPFHEFQPNGWFWWSKGTAQQFQELWQYMFDYLNDTKGLTNLLWLAPSSGSPDANWYPNKATYDIAGPDTYDTAQPFTSLYSQTENIVGATVPIALHETGRIPQPDQMFPSAAPWLMFNVWSSYQSDGQHNTMNEITSAYASSYTITRDELPDLR